MTQSALARIQDVMNDAQGREEESPHITPAHYEQATTQRHRIIAGLAVEDDEAHERVLEEARTSRRDQWSAFQRTKESLVRSLGQVGVVPKAVLPKVAWERMCEEAGLYRFSPDEEGRVGISTKVVADSEFATEITMAGVALSIGIACLALTAHYVGAPLAEALRLTGMSFYVGTAVTTAVTLVAGGWMLLKICSFFEFLTKIHPVEALAERIERFWIRTKLSGEHVHVMARCFRDRRDDKSHGSPKVAIGLPTAPADVAEVLLNAVKLRDMPMHVVAVPEAVSFLESPADVVIRSRQRHWNVKREQRDRDLWMQYDPIVFVEKDGVVALLAQFGEFPIEEDVMHRATSAEHLF